jgi:hypothetical protein
MYREYKQTLIGKSMGERNARRRFYITKPSGYLEFAAAMNRQTMKFIKQAERNINAEPILVCNCRNDLAKVKLQIAYYRTYGIKHFCYIDNMSNDGTYEYLLSCNDVSLFQTAEKYKSAVSSAWKRQVMQMFGFDKWYLIVDSDELLCYPGIEKLSIPEFTKKMQSRGYNAISAFMLDMYQSKGELFAGSENNLYEDFSYFEINCFTKLKMNYGYWVSGGWRNKNTGALLTKYPLVKITSNCIYDAHFLYGTKRRIDSVAFSPLIAVLLHYKFTVSDLERYKRIVAEKNYANGSVEYKRYIELGHIQHSISNDVELIKMNTSYDLQKVGILESG